MKSRQVLPLVITGHDHGHGRHLDGGLDAWHRHRNRGGCRLYRFVERIRARPAVGDGDQVCSFLMKASIPGLGDSGRPSGPLGPPDLRHSFVEKQARGFSLPSPFGTSSTVSQHLKLLTTDRSGFQLLEITLTTSIDSSCQCANFVRFLPCSCLTKFIQKSGLFTVLRIRNIFGFG